jgi:hypothetical protein
MTQFHGTFNDEPVSEKVKEFRRKNTPAFPVNVYEGHTRDGMTLRDYFAAKAMQAYLLKGECDNMSIKQITAGAYVMADALMKAREE